MRIAVKRETIVNLWVLGILLLALSVLIPFPWVEFKVRDVESGVIAYSSVNPASDISSKNGPIFTSTLVLVCAALITGFLFLFALFRWSIHKDSSLWYWGEITIALVILTLIVFNLNPVSIYGHEDKFSGSRYYQTTWYPHIGFYLVIVSVIFLVIGQILFRKVHSKDSCEGHRQNRHGPRIADDHERWEPRTPINDG